MDLRLLEEESALSTEQPHTLVCRHLAHTDVRGKRVFIRADFNVPLDASGDILDDTRIRASLPAIRYALYHQAAVMVTSHLGCPKTGDTSVQYSLVAVARRLSALLGCPVPLLKNWLTSAVNVRPGEMVLLENCRLNDGETDNSLTLAQTISHLFDIYVNDAFAVSHRVETTTTALAHCAAYACAGHLLVQEMCLLDQVMHNPARPIVAVIGGAKIKTKLPALFALAKHVDTLIIGGSMANTFLLNPDPLTECSEVELAQKKLANQIALLMANRQKELALPKDVVCSGHPTLPHTLVKSVQDVQLHNIIVDVGPQSIAYYRALILAANTVLWNGPVGIFERAGCAAGTAAICQAVADTAGFSVVGGGNTILALRNSGLAERVDYICTGGGAFLDYIAYGTLPAIEALKREHCLPCR